MILPLPQASPKIGRDVFVSPDAWVIGDVTLEEEVSVFIGSVLRGDLLPIRVAKRTNIQEHCLLHTTHGRTPTIVGEEVTVGHRAIIHGANVARRCLIGMGAIILDGAVIEEECIIGAGALVPEGMHVPRRSLLLGVPARVKRTLSEEEMAMLADSAARYVDTGRVFAAILAKNS